MFSVANAEEVKLVRVIDGDTFVITPNVRVRLIGINAPEMDKNGKPEPYAVKAKSTASQKLTNATKIRLETDGSKYDKYNRRLALVYVKSGNKEILLNEYLIEQGLATFESQYYYSEKMKTKFKAAERKAKMNRKNLWKNDSNVKKSISK
jgi:micrococcal nuclease